MNAASPQGPSAAARDDDFSWADLEAVLASDRADLVAHSVYRAVDSLPALRRFMQSHVFAVWDFMSLTKRLQRELTCTELPWMPPRDPELARFVNEVVLDEESDRGPDGRPTSHLDLYLRAMDEVGADTEPFRAFLAAIRGGEDPIRALAAAPVPDAVRAFVTATLRCAVRADAVEVAAWFLFGREDVIPDMFTRLLEADSVVASAPCLAFYLRRHVELDGGEHGDLARALVRALMTDAEAGGMERVERAARDAIGARIALWDGVLADLRVR